jgi:HAD superfamily hydrolase (TIGR01490 family)
VKLALFDLDNTLLAGDSDYAWAEFLMEEGVLDRAAFDEKNKWFLKEYERGTIRMEDWLEFQLAPLTTRTKEQLQDWHREFMRRKVGPLILPKARELIARHEDALRVIITATNRFIVGPICGELGVLHVIASEIEERDGVPTGRPRGTPSFGPGKVTRLTEWLALRGQALGDFSESWFYSDSHNDIPLLERVTHPVAVDPDAQLREVAAERDWPVISLREAAPSKQGSPS